MIIVDTSVWIDYFNGAISRETDILDAALGNRDVAIGDFIVLQTLRGFRLDKEHQIAVDYLARLEQFAMLTPQFALKAADYYRTLRKQDITIRKSADIIIATFCIEKKLPLLFSDRDFIPFSEHFGLRLVTAEY